MSIISEIKQEYRENPDEVIHFFAAIIAMTGSMLLWPGDKLYLIPMVVAFFLLIMNGIDIVEKRLERIEAQIKISNMLETEVRNLKRHQLKVEGKL